MLFAALARRTAAPLVSVVVALALAAARAEAQGGPLGQDTVVGQLYELARSDYRTAATVRRLERDDAYFATNPNAKSSVTAEERRRLVALARNPDLRPVLTEAALEDLRARSRAIGSGLTDLRRRRAFAFAAKQEGSVAVDPRFEVWDVVVVGAGVHDQILNNVLSIENPSLRVLTIEETDRVASNFALANQVGRINSSNRPSNADQFPRPGVGNLNEFPGGPVQVPDASAVKFPTFRTLADVATVNRAASKADVLFNTSVVSVEDKELTPNVPWPARYRVALGDGNEVYAGAVVFSTGLGEPTVPNIELNSRAALQVGSKGGNVFTYESFVRAAAGSKNPYRPFAGKKIGVVGTGDSAKVAIEWLLRLAPDGAYGNDTAQVGLFEKIFWVGQDKPNCDAYIRNVRVRYADIAGGIKNGSVQPVAGKLTVVEQVEGGPYLLRTDQGLSAQVDQVILATGFKSRLEKVLEKIVQTDAQGRPLGPENPIQNSTAVVPLQGAIGGQEPGRERTVIIAQQLAPVLRGREQQVYFIGAAVGEIVPADELRGITENKKSIFALGPRTAATAKLLAKRTPIAVAPPAGGPTFEVLPGTTPTAVVLDAPPALADADRELSPFSDLLVEAQLNSLLRKSVKLAPDVRSTVLDIRRGAGGEINIGFNQPVGDAALAKRLFESDPSLVRGLAALVGSASAEDPRYALQLTLTRGPSGETVPSGRMRIAPADTDGITGRVSGGTSAP